MVTELAAVLAPSVLASLVPTLLYIWLVWRLDRYEKEPAYLLAAALLWGALPAAALAVLLELAFEAPLAALGTAYTEFISSSLIAPPVEELLKGLALLGVARWARREFDGLLDGVIYGSVVGLGFAFSENILYFTAAWGRGDLHNWGLVVLTRSLAFGLNHAMYTSFTGAGIGIARHRPTRGQRTAAVLAGLLLAIGAHALHNALLATQSLCWVSLLADWMGVLVILVVVLLAWQHERALMREHLAPEVASGLVTQQQYDLIVSRRRRWRQSFRLLGLAGVQQTRIWRRLVAAATEFAFKQHQAVNDKDAKLEARLALLRERIGELQAQLAAVQTASDDPPPAGT